MPPRLRTTMLTATALAVTLHPLAARAADAALTLATVNRATFAPLPEPRSRKPSAIVLRAEILLDRARFSPGAIDGIDGENFCKAVLAYQQQAGLPASGHLDQATWDRLTSTDKAPALVSRAVSAAEAKGPFTRTIPPHMEAQARLHRLGYRNLTEELAEENHSSPGLLKALNPGGIAPGKALVGPQVVVDRGASALVTRIVVDKATKAVDAYGADGHLLAFYPASIGSSEKPAPSGTFVVEHVTHNPDYTYNPRYAFKGVKARKPFTIAPGPNNPVGSVWMALSDEGYGIHGTPEPDQVGKTQSHGCIRLTNWDAEDLAGMVKKDTPVVFQDQPEPPQAPEAAGAPAAPQAMPDASPSPEASGAQQPQPATPSAPQRTP